MALRVWDPFRDTVSLGDAMNRLFQESFVRPGAWVNNALYAAPLDVEETADGYTVKASLPGYKPEEVNVTVMGDTLTIEAEHKPENEEGRNYLLRERRFGKVMRSITLPAAIESNGVQAWYEHGELILTLPKAESVKPRRIEITSGEQQSLSGGTPSGQVIDHKPAKQAA